MATQAERIVRIESEDGKRQYAVSEETYHATYAGSGYKIVSFEDGTAYAEDSEPTAYAMDARARTAEIGTGGSEPVDALTHQEEPHSLETLVEASRAASQPATGGPLPQPATEPVAASGESA